MTTRSPFRSLAAILIAVVLLPLIPQSLGANEKHQPVHGVRVTRSQVNDALEVEIVLGNGDLIKRSYSGKEDMTRVMGVLDLATRKDVSLYADLDGKTLASLTVEFGAPIPYESRK